MFRTSHIRTKLAVALAIPMVALVLVAGFEVVTATADVDDTRTQTELATSAIGPGSLVVRLQDERNRASIDLIGLGDAAKLAVDTNEEARGLVDKAATDLRANLAGEAVEVQATFAPALEALDALGKIRSDIDAYDGPTDLTNDEFADEVFSRYTSIVETFFDATSTVALAVDDADLRNGVQIIDAATRQSEMRARIVRRAVLAVVTGTADQVSTRQDIAALYDRSKGFDSVIRLSSVGPFEGVDEATFAETNVQAFTEQVRLFLAGKDLDITAMLDAVASTDDATGYLGLRGRTGDALRIEADRIVDEAVERQRMFAGIAVAALLSGMLITSVASRSITKPLRSLKQQAEHMAGESLPSAVRQILDTPPGEDVVIPEVEPIKVKSKDEVAGVAGALNAVQTSALDLAVEQAVLRRNISDSYINLGRRNQNLLTRQLDLITDLERHESDPEALEGLFRLDHLATRMRRNAESLLVLAGIEPPRQWSAPVKVSDVVRAALGEVEDYQRVLVRHLEPASVLGSVASDVAHVVAELLENALTFSPPEQSVEVKGRLTTSGYTIAITDNGLGMSPDEVQRSNRRLAGAESFTVAPSRYLGHYVAGHLASRMGVVVELQDSPAGGVTARLDLPMELLANEETDSYLIQQVARADEEAARIAALEAAKAAPEVDEPSTPIPVVEQTFTESGLVRRGGDRPAEPVVEQSFLAEPPAAADPVMPTYERTAPAAPAMPTYEPPAPAAPAVPTYEYREPSPAPAPREPIAPSYEYEAPVPAPAPAPSEPVMPSYEAPTRGFGGLAPSAPPAPSAPDVAPAPDEPTSTPTGLTRRIRGAQRPDVSDDTTPRAPVPQQERSTPEDVYAFLSSFQSGVARGRADASALDLDPTEDDR